MNKQHYDLIAIGAGSGGLAVAEQAAAYGKKVAKLAESSWSYMRFRMIRAVAPAPWRPALLLTSVPSPYSVRAARARSSCSAARMTHPAT